MANATQVFIVLVLANSTKATDSPLMREMEMKKSLYYYNKTPLRPITNNFERKSGAGQTQTPGEDRLFYKPYKMPFWGLPYGVYSKGGFFNPGLFPFVPGGVGFPPYDGVFGSPYGPGQFPGSGPSPFPTPPPALPSPAPMPATPAPLPTMPPSAAPSYNDGYYYYPRRRPRRKPKPKPTKPTYIYCNCPQPDDDDEGYYEDEEGCNCPPKPKEKPKPSPRPYRYPKRPKNPPSCGSYGCRDGRYVSNRRPQSSSSSNASKGRGKGPCRYGYSSGPYGGCKPPPKRKPRPRPMSYSHDDEEDDENYGAEEEAEEDAEAEVEVIPQYIPVYFGYPYPPSTASDGTPNPSANVANTTAAAAYSEMMAQAQPPIQLQHQVSFPQMQGLHLPQLAYQSSSAASPSDPSTTQLVLQYLPANSPPQSTAQSYQHPIPNNAMPYPMPYLTTMTNPVPVTPPQPVPSLPQVMNYTQQPAPMQYAPVHHQIASAQLPSLISYQVPATAPSPQSNPMPSNPPSLSYPYQTPVMLTYTANSGSNLTPHIINYTQQVLPLQQYSQPPQQITPPAPAAMGYQQAPAVAPQPGSLILQYLTAQSYNSPPTSANQETPNVASKDTMTTSSSNNGYVYTHSPSQGQQFTFPSLQIVHPQGTYTHPQTIVYSPPPTGGYLYGQEPSRNDQTPKAGDANLRTLNSEEPFISNHLNNYTAQSLQKRKVKIKQSSKGNERNHKQDKVRKEQSDTSAQDSSDVQTIISISSSMSEE